MMFIDNDCPSCLGTGIGRHGDPSASRCMSCMGRGYLIDDPNFDDDYDDAEEMIWEAEAKEIRE